MIIKLKRKQKIIIVLLFLLLSLAGGIVYYTWFRRPASFSDFPNTTTPGAVFSEPPSVTVPDKDTIEVDGERVPGGKGLWRYHISTGRWERVASRVVVTDEDRPEGVRYPVDRGWVLSYRATDEPMPEKEMMPEYETKCFIRIRLRDGKVFPLGTIRHTPRADYCSELPDGSGFFALELRPVRKDWSQPVIHWYQYGTMKWRTIVTPWYLTGFSSFARAQKFSVIPRRGAWVVVNSMNRGVSYSDASFKKKYEGELWVNLSTGACRLGEPATSDFLTDFSPDGQYCYMEQKIMQAPDWPRGLGVVGKTYSRMPQIGALPELMWNGTEGPCWSPDSRLIMYFKNESDGPFSNPSGESLRSFIESHTPLRLPPSHSDRIYHLVDVTGREVGKSLGYWPSFVGEDVLTDVTDLEINHHPDDTKDASMPRRYFLVSPNGTVKREVFRVLP